jgi:hypothetical protein
MLNVAVLLIAWRRPKHLSQVISAIRTVRPKQLFVAVDGPRPGDEYARERDLIQETKKVVEKEIDWICELKTLYRDENLGCAQGVSSAITWFFEHVEEGIILEDDCVPSDDFFEFMTSNLLKFKEDESVFHVAGFSNFATIPRSNMNYFKSYYGHIWGWATWKRAWEFYTLEIQDTDEDIDKSLKVVKSSNEYKYWFDLFKLQRDNPLDTWDYSWQYQIFKRNARAIYPFESKVVNIGFDEMAVHTKTMVSIPESTKINLPRFLLYIKVFNSYLNFIAFNNAFKKKYFYWYNFRVLFIFLSSRVNRDFID